MNLDSSPISSSTANDAIARYADVVISSSNPASPLKEVASGKEEGHDQAGKDDDEWRNPRRSNSTSRLVYQKLSTVPFEPIQGEAEIWSGGLERSESNTLPTTITNNRSCASLITVEGVSDRLTQAFQKAVPSVKLEERDQSAGEKEGERAVRSRGSRRKSRERERVEKNSERNSERNMAAPIFAAGIEALQASNSSPPKPKKSKVRILPSKRSQESIEEEVRGSEERSSELATLA